MASPTEGPKRNAILTALSGNDYDKQKKEFKLELLDTDSKHVEMRDRGLFDTASGGAEWRVDFARPGWARFTAKCEIARGTRFRYKKLAEIGRKAPDPTEESTSRTNYFKFEIQLTWQEDTFVVRAGELLVVLTAVPEDQLHNDPLQYLRGRVNELQTQLERAHGKIDRENDDAVTTRKNNFIHEAMAKLGEALRVEAN